VSIKTVRVFLTIKPVRPRGSGKVSHFKASWVRGTSTDLYTSKPCVTSEEAVKLARAWLTKRNAPISRMEGGLVHDQSTQYIDTTNQPERFGYSLNEGACAMPHQPHTSEPYIARPSTTLIVGWEVLRLNFDPSDDKIGTFVAQCTEGEAKIIAEALNRALVNGRIK
jgi:hypothetical protein